MRCNHGLDRRFCALCNRVTLLQREPFRGVRQDDTPRLRKGRDSAVWVGAGERTECGAGSMAMRSALQRNGIVQPDTRLQHEPSREVVGAVHTSETVTLVWVECESREPDATVVWKNGQKHYYRQERQVTTSRMRWERIRF